MRWTSVLACFFAASTAAADEFHYNDQFAGTRAAGLAGTMVGLADEPSAAYYNPAGLAHGQAELLTLSATAIVRKVLVLKELFGSDLDMPSTEAFSVASVTSSPLRSGRLAIASFTPSSGGYRTDRRLEAPAAESGLREARFGRERTDNTYWAGLAYGQDVGRDFDLGVAAYYVFRTWRGHDVDYRWADAPSFEDGAVAFERFRDEHGLSHGLTIVLGLLYHPWGEEGPFRLGLAVTTGINLSETAVAQEERFLGFAEPTAVDPDRVRWERRASMENRDSGAKVPPALKVGASWRVVDGWLIAADFSLHGYVKYESLGQMVEKLATWNASAATEVRVASGFVLRAGFYTNRSSAPKDSASASLRPDAWDEYGGTLGGTVAGKRYSFSLAGKLGWMHGRAGVAATETGNEVFDVSGTDMAITLGGGYHF